MVEYQELKREYRSNYTDIKTTENLALVLNQYKKIDKKHYISLIKDLISQSTNPVLFLKQIEKNIKEK